MSLLFVTVYHAIISILYMAIYCQLCYIHSLGFLYLQSAQRQLSFHKTDPWIQKKVCISPIFMPFLINILIYIPQINLTPTLRTIYI